MKTLFAIVNCLVFFTTIALAQSNTAPVCPAVINQGPQQEVCLGQNIEALFRQRDAGFRPFSKNQFHESIPALFKDETSMIPMAITADFNGDKKNDLIVMGQSPTARGAVDVVVYAALSNPRNERFVLQEVVRWSQRDYEIPGQGSPLNASKQITGWRVYLQLASKDEVEANHLPNSVAVLKLESDSAFFGFYSFLTNQRRSHSASTPSSKAPERIPSQSQPNKK